MMTTNFTEAEVQEVLNYQIEFGKHKGTTIKNLIENTPQYAMWIVGQGESNNKSFMKAQTFIKLVLNWGEDGPGGVDSSKIPPAKKKGIGIPPHPFKKNNLVSVPDGVWFYTWISLLPNDPDNFTFAKSEDSLAFATMMESWVSYQTDSFVIIKRTGAGGDFLKMHIARELIDYEKGRFLNVAA
jgi:hypothetical protein